MDGSGLWALCEPAALAEHDPNRWRNGHRPTYAHLPVRCGECGTRWFHLWPRKAYRNPRVRFAWKDREPGSHLPTTLLVACRCRPTAVQVNVVRLVNAVGEQLDDWRRLGEVIFGPGRYADQYPRRRWPRSNADSNAVATAR